MREFEPLFSVNCDIRGNRNLSISIIGKHHKVPWHTSLYDTSEKVTDLISEIEQLQSCTDSSNLEALGINDLHITVQGDECIVSGYYDENGPNEHRVPTDFLLKTYSKFRDWLIEYEACRIPGVIPADKLESWVVVPRLFVDKGLLDNLHK